MASQAARRQSRRLMRQAARPPGNGTAARQFLAKVRPCSGRNAMKRPFARMQRRFAGPHLRAYFLECLIEPARPVTMTALL